MKQTQLQHLYPTFPVIAEALGTRFPGIRSVIRDPELRYRSIQRYSGQPLQKDIVYLLTEGDARHFPREEYAYLSGDKIDGGANHICCPGRSTLELLEQMAALFLEFREIENRIVGLIYENAKLRDLCELGEALLGNPICIHDSWFMILARSRGTETFMPVSREPWEVFPDHFLDDFLMDAEYQKTYQKQGVQLWESNVGGRKLHTLYVNLTDQDAFRGRFLVSDTLRPFRERDRMIAHLLAQQAQQMMKEHRAVPAGHRGTDEILRDILGGIYVPSAEFSALLRVLQWEKSNRFLCIRLQRQDREQASPADHRLHRELFLAFPGSYVLYTEDQQCIILNLTSSGVSAAEIRHRLAPLCRDYCQYGGISSPAEGIQELPIAFLQAQEALDSAFRMRNERWIVRFHECAMEYVLTHLQTPMQLRNLAAPQLLELKEYDLLRGSQLFETLRVYLDNDRDIPRTAEKLIIHRTTLTYRLKKIAAILDLDLEDPEIRLYLRLSLRMLEQEKTVKLSENITT